MSAVVRLRFRADINFEAQQVLARLFAQLAQSMEGVSTCSVRFEPARGDWIAHMGGTGTPLRIGDSHLYSVVPLDDEPRRRERS